jgi:cytochrome P450 family 135
MPGQNPPGPRSRLRNTYDWMRHPAELMENGRARYGDVWTLGLMRGTTFVLVSDPKLVEQVFKTDPTELHAGEANSMIGTALLGENSVLLLDEEAHTTQRKLLQMPLHHDRVHRYREVMTRLCEEEVASWPLREPIPLLPRMQSITLRVIMTAIFGVTGGPQQERLHSRIQGLLQWASSPWRMTKLHLAHRRGKSLPKDFLAARNPLDEVILEEIERARKDPRIEERDDILALLLQAKHEDGSPMTDSELRDELMTLLIQGHTSTATALSWAFERLARHPDSLERLRTEAQNGGEEYLDAVFHEVLRLRPPIPIAPRQATRPYRLGEHEIEEGTLIAPAIYSVHRREDVYPEPERFRPERFLDQPAGTYTWIPFGGGDRHCVGRSFATSEIKTVIRTVALQARLAPAEQADEGITRRGILFSPKDSAKVVVKERVPAPGAAGVPAS